MKRDIKQIRRSIQQIEQMMVLLVEKQVGGGVGWVGEATGALGRAKDPGSPAGAQCGCPARFGADLGGVRSAGSLQTRHERTSTQPDEFMTIREAYLELNVSRSTIDKLRKQGDLTSYYHNNHVRLLRSEVMAAKRWYSSMKGKL